MNEGNEFYSTNDKSLSNTLKEAMFQGLAIDRGLYMPKRTPDLSQSFLRSLHGKNFIDVAFEIAKALLGNVIPEDDLQGIIHESFPFDAPLHRVEGDVYALELFHGPTLSFKDFGARFMARLFGYFLEDNEKPLNILVATSGDTGSAVAHGFYGVPGVRVWVLYPSGKVSAIQEKQMTTLDKNVTAIEVEGTFDDCQRLVKEAFADSDLRRLMHITSANSINIARLIPQTFYYFHAWAQLPSSSEPVVVSVPSGNFGNLTAGLIAKRMGLPIESFVASTNINDVVPQYLQTGIFTPRPSQQTLSNAMDVGNPSNFARILDLYQGDYKRIKQDVFGASFSDTDTTSAIWDVYQRTGYTLDPHGAVAYLGLKAFMKQKNFKGSGIFLETAHPAKFKETVEQCIKKDVECPKRLEECLHKEKHSVVIPNNYSTLKALITAVI